MYSSGGIISEIPKLSRHARSYIIQQFIFMRDLILFNSLYIILYWPKHQLQPTSCHFEMQSVFSVLFCGRIMVCLGDYTTMNPWLIGVSAIGQSIDSFKKGED